MLDCSTVGGLRSFVFLKLPRYWLRRNQNYSGNFERTKIWRATFSSVFNDLSAGQFFSNSFLLYFLNKSFCIHTHRSSSPTRNFISNKSLRLNTALPNFFSDFQDIWPTNGEGERRCAERICHHARENRIRN